MSSHAPGACPSTRRSAASPAASGSRSAPGARPASSRSCSIARARRRCRRLRLAGADDDRLTRTHGRGWGLLDKRQPVFAYLVVVAFVLFHRAIVGLFFAPTYGRHAAPSAQCRSWLLRAVGAIVVAVAAYCWLGAEALRDVVPAGEAIVAKFYRVSLIVHLGALEQIRLGATCASRRRRNAAFRDSGVWPLHQGVRLQQSRLLCRRPAGRHCVCIVTLVR